MPKGERLSLDSTLSAADIFRLRRKGEGERGGAYGKRHDEWAAYGKRHDERADEIWRNSKVGTNRMDPQEIGKCGFALGMWFYRYAMIPSLKWDEWWEDNALIVHAGDLVKLCGTGISVSLILAGITEAADLMKGVAKSYTAPLAEADGQERMLHGVHPILLYDVVSGICNDVETIVAAEGQMVRCFADARSEWGRFCFFELWIDVIARLVPATVIAEKCKDVYMKVSRALEEDGKGSGSDGAKESLETKCRDALGEVPSTMMAVRALCKVELQFARCPKKKWRLHNHEASLELGCIVSLLTVGACLHGGNASHEELVRSFREHTGLNLIESAEAKSEAKKQTD